MSRALLYLCREFWPVLLLLVVWHIWVASAAYNSIVLVPPAAVFSDLIQHPDAYLGPTLRTITFALGGLVIGMFAGLVLAVSAWLSEVLSGMVTPLALLVSSTPVVCLIPILARIFGYKSRTELVTVAVITFFPSLVYCASGLHDLPPMSAEVFAVLHASKWERLRLLALPAAIPSLAVAVRIGATSSVLIALLAEYLMQTGGLGTLFAVTMQQFNLRRALGASVLAMVFSALLYEASSLLERHVVARYLTNR